MNFLCLILISSLAFMWTAVTGCIRNDECKEDECCNGGRIQGNCVKLGSEGSSCTLRKHHVYLNGPCPCLPGLICDPVDEEPYEDLPLSLLGDFGKESVPTTTGEPDKSKTDGICKVPKDVSSNA